MEEKYLQPHRGGSNDGVMGIFIYRHFDIVVRRRRVDGAPKLVMRSLETEW